MDLYPAIDLRGGRCVQLAQGDFARERVYADDPVAIARGFESEGARWIHMVDLDAARTGVAGNRDAITAVAAAVGVPVQASGGVRSEEAVRALLGAGVSRVVIGTAAFTVPGLVERVAAAYPGKVAVGLDHRRAGDRREVAVAGWQEGSGTDLMEALAHLTDAGAAAVVVTDIDRDGMLGGPDIDGMAEVLAAAGAGLDVIASGGVSSLEDLRALAALSVSGGSASSGRGLAGAIVGTAIYEGRFSVAEGVRACGR